MHRKVSRRELIAGGVALGVAPKAFPEIFVPHAVKPLIVCSSNGHGVKNGGTETAIEKAFRLMTRGSDVLDSLIEGVNIVELDPKDMSVGYGGLPNAEGVVQLDASVMHGPLKRAGAVACLEGVR